MSFKITNISPRKTVMKGPQTISIPVNKKPVSKIITTPEYKVSNETLLIVRGDQESTITLNSFDNHMIIVKSLTTVLVKPDIGKIDEEWDELVMEKGSCVQLFFVDGNWYILSSDGLKMG
jgi:hypothetical protein